MKAASKSFSDRTLAFDLEWVEAWASARDERHLRLQALQQRAREEGYLAQAVRTQQVLAASGAMSGLADTKIVPLPPYARVGAARGL